MNTNIRLLGAKVTLFDICQPLDASTKFVDSLSALALLLSAAYCFGKEFFRRKQQLLLPLFRLNCQRPY